MKIASETVYTSLATFETIEQLNEAVRHYKDMIADMDLRQDLKRNLLTVLEYIKRHSCRYFGVSWKGKRKIATDLSLSDKTITRICKRLESLGIVKQHAMKRASDMNQTSNAIVIQPVKLCDIAQSVRQEPAKVSDQENNISLKQNLYIHNTYPNGVVPLSPYAKFKEYVKYFVNDPKLTNRLYGVYMAQTHYIRDVFGDDNLLDIGLAAIKTAFQATKRKKIRNIAGYFDGTLERMLDRLHDDTIVEYYGSRSDL
jgi:DNA-binding Lrp family transcriptional regulator